jgi:hypothetical protein
MNIGFFGDSYIANGTIWTQIIRQLMPQHEFEVTGKGGSNLYYAINEWRQREQQYGADHYDVAVFTLTWPERLFSVWPYRNEQFCAFSEFRKWEVDSEICNEQDNKEFLNTIPHFYRYIHDREWREFDWELEIQWIMTLAQRHPHTRFIVIPNTEQARGIARKYHRHGLLLDFAFETLSNCEPNSPGIMPIVDMQRSGHLNDHNHQAIAEMVRDLILNLLELGDAIVPVDFSKFSVVS